MKYRIRNSSVRSVSRSLVAGGICLLCSLAAAAESELAGLKQTFASEIRPLIARYCSDCHSPDLAEADLDLASMATFDEVRKHPRSWQKVAEMLSQGLMPPAESERPNAEEQQRLATWLHSYLTIEARERAGDPGRVVLRRLSNAEYTYTLRDLTELPELDPAREFPVDGAAGEGFTNTGNALVMSPTLFTKYLDASRELATHAVLLPDGFRFSAKTTRRDWSDEVLHNIREFYDRYSEAQGGSSVNLQGIVFDTNQGGRLPVERYLAATLTHREALLSGRKTTEQLAREQDLNPKYLKLLYDHLTKPDHSLLLAQLQRDWRQAEPTDVDRLVAQVTQWQRGLWAFRSVGHIGKVGGPKAWQEPVSPIASRHDYRLSIPADQTEDVTLALVASNAGDGSEHDLFQWINPRFAAPGRPDLRLRDVRELAFELLNARRQMLASTGATLAAVDELLQNSESLDVATVAERHGVALGDVQSWMTCLGYGSGNGVELKGLFTDKITSSKEYEFIQGWGSHSTPLVLANPTDQHVRVPGNMWPHRVAVHPSPTQRTVIAWKCPTAGSYTVSGSVTHAHPECGNGVTWTLEQRQGGIHRRLATGVSQGGQPVTIEPTSLLHVAQGEVITLAIGPRDGNHACDLTTVDLTLTRAGDDKQTWDLAADVSGDILAGNPHADRYGNAQVWHFLVEPDQDVESVKGIPNGSLLARWISTTDRDARTQLGQELQQLLTAAAPEDRDSPDGQLYQQLVSLNGTLLSFRRHELLKKLSEGVRGAPAAAQLGELAWGLDPQLFGKRPDGSLIDANSLCLAAPTELSFQLPAELVAGTEFVVTGQLDPEQGAEGSVQLSVATGTGAGQLTSLMATSPAPDSDRNAARTWTDAKQVAGSDRPVLVNENSAARARFVRAFDDFRELFPVALCYTKIVPVDEVVTLRLYHREDDHLMRLMLSDEECAELDRYWEELHYISHDAVKLVDVFEQLMEYASQDADPGVFAPLREPIQARAAAFQQYLVDTEPAHLQALMRFADKAIRRPLTAIEEEQLQGLYGTLRSEGLSHDDAFRMVLVRVLVSPEFLYKVETPVEGSKQGPITDWELATRLSYFLWSSLPDDELRELAERGELHQPEVLRAQTQRMLADPKTRRLAIHFGCQWLHIADFDQHDEKSDSHFPTFAGLRDDMYEESIQFFTALFQQNGTMEDLVAADYTFLNEDLAKHYGVPGVTGPEWRRVDGVKQFHRGGILTQASTLARQSGASRTSPILRGIWVSETLLGERLPRPPKGVPPLPEDRAATEGKTVRELVELHSSNPKCVICHQRIDPMGFSLESFDAIGRWRNADQGGRPIDTDVKTMDGIEFSGVDGLQDYLLNVRKETFQRQFCRKLLGYALGRSAQLSDEPLLSEMQQELDRQGGRIAVVVESIVSSPQFREIRGLESAQDE